MREFNLEEKYIIDKQIKALNNEQYVYFKKNYKEVKNEYAFLALTVTLGIFAAPFFYIGWKNVKIETIILLIVNIIILTIMCFIYLIAMFFGLSVMVEIIIGLIELGFYYFVYYRSYDVYKGVVESHNYNEKVRVLKRIISQ